MLEFGDGEEGGRMEGRKERQLERKKGPIRDNRVPGYRRTGLWTFEFYLFLFLTGFLFSFYLHIYKGRHKRRKVRERRNVGRDEMGGYEGGGEDSPRFMLHVLHHS